MSKLKLEKEAIASRVNRNFLAGSGRLW